MVVVGNLDSKIDRLGPCDFDLACFMHKEQDPLTMGIKNWDHKHVFKDEMVKWIKTLVSLSISVVPCTFIQYGCMKISYSLKGGCRSEGAKNDLGVSMS